MASYLTLYKNDKLKEIKNILHDRLKSCDLCPHSCKINRLKNEKGKCKTGKLAKVCSFSPHHGEENPISGHKGSGTIFFSECNMNCQFCQNYDISQLGYGKEVSAEELGDMMLRLQSIGCHNVNFVSPSHVIYQIIEALYYAVKKGLYIPLVYNTGGYDKVETLIIINGVFDIYMPDMKYGDADVGLRLSKVNNYPEINQKAVLEMYKQVGDLMIDSNGIAERGLLIRHLVMPDNLANTEKLVKFLSEYVSIDTYINIMGQYHPAYNSRNFIGLGRRIFTEELKEAYNIAKKYGLYRFDKGFY